MSTVFKARADIDGVTLDNVGVTLREQMGLIPTYEATLTKVGDDQTLPAAQLWQGAVTGGIIDIYRQALNMDGSVLSNTRYMRGVIKRIEDLHETSLITRKVSGQSILGKLAHKRFPRTIFTNARVIDIMNAILAGTVIADDGEAAFWTAAFTEGGAGAVGTPTLANSTTTVKVGTDSLQITVPTGTAANWGIRKNLASAADYSSYDYVSFWFYDATATVKTLNFRLHTTLGTAYFQWALTTSGQVGWQRFTRRLGSPDTTVGAPNLNNINNIEFVVAASPTGAFYFDRLTMTKYLGEGQVDSFGFLPQMKKWDTDTDFNLWTLTNMIVSGTGPAAIIKLAATAGVLTGNGKSPSLAPSPFNAWKTFTAVRTIPAGASITWGVLDPNNADAVITGYGAIADSALPKDISAITQNAVKVRANLTAVLTEKQNSLNNVGSDSLGTTTWDAQQFQATAGFTNINRVILLLSDGFAAGTNVTVSIRNTDAGGKPTGADLVTASVTLANDSVFRAVTFDFPELTLTLNTVYAIVVRSTNNGFGWARSSASAANQDSFQSTDSGTTWGAARGVTMYFDTYQRDAPTIDTVEIDYTADSMTVTQDYTMRAQFLQSLYEWTKGEFRASLAPDEQLDYMTAIGTDRSASITVDSNKAKFTDKIQDMNKQTNNVYLLGGGTPPTRTETNRTSGNALLESVGVEKTVNDSSTLQGIGDKILSAQQNAIIQYTAKLLFGDQDGLNLGDTVNVNDPPLVTNTAYRIMMIDRKYTAAGQEEVELQLANYEYFLLERQLQLIQKMLEFQK